MVPSGLIGAGSAISGHFDRDRAADYRELIRDPRTLLVTVIRDPIEVHRAVYRHVVRSEPETRERRPKVFATEESFLESRKDEVTRGLAQALGKRRVRVGSFRSVLVEERMEESMREFVTIALGWAKMVGAPSRIISMLGAAKKFDGALTDAFGGGQVCQREGRTPPGFAERNAGDVQFYRDAVRALEEGQPRARKSFFQRWKPALPIADEPVFVFNHLPKCFGTSLRVFFQGAFGSVEDHTEFLGRVGLLDDEPIDCERLAADTMLMGHFAHGALRLRVRYPEIWADRRRYRLFSFVREPLSAAVSSFYHVTDRTTGPVVPDPGLFSSLDTYLRRVNNPLAAGLGWSEGEDVKAVGERYFFVGRAEAVEREVPRLLAEMRSQLDGAVASPTTSRALAAISALEGRALPHANASSGRRIEIDPETEAIFRERNAVDYRLYALAADRGEGVGND